MLDGEHKSSQEDEALVPPYSSNANSFLWPQYSNSTNQYKV